MRPKDYTLIFGLLAALVFSLLQGDGCKPRPKPARESFHVAPQSHNEPQNDSPRDSSEVVPSLDAVFETDGDKTGSKENSVATDESVLNESVEEVREAPQGQRVEIERAVDGDTLIVRYAGKRERVRLIGVDTPETVKPNNPVEPLGPEASAYTKKRVEETGKVATLVSDGTEFDDYDRRLAFVYLGDETVSLNEDLARQGLGKVELGYTYSQKMKDRLQKCADLARSEKLGLYGDNVPSIAPPSDYQSAAPTTEIRPSVQGERVRIERVVNGDTLIANGQRVQLIGADAPEPGAATDYVQRRVAAVGGVATLVSDGDLYDNHGRRLAFVYLGDDTVSLNEELVSLGLAEPRLHYNYSQEMKNRLRNAAIRR